MNPARIIFFGTAAFAVPSLLLLLKKGFNVVAVVTAPDKPAGRGNLMRPSPVGVCAQENNIKVLKPADLRSEALIDELKTLRPDVQMVVAFRKLPVEIWSIPPLGTINLHASLLPQYRGAAPINWAIINGESITGLTTFFINDSIDTGDIIRQVKLGISDEEDAGQLAGRMMQIGAGLLADTAEMVIQGRPAIVNQSDLNTGSEILRPAPKLTRENCLIRWESDTHYLKNFVRGLAPEPGAYSYLVFPGKEALLVKFYKAFPADDMHLAPGEIDTGIRGKLFVGTGDGAIDIRELQLAGRKRMNADALLRGINLTKCFFSCLPE